MFVEFFCNEYKRGLNIVPKTSVFFTQSLSIYSIYLLILQHMVPETCVYSSIISEVHVNGVVFLFKSEISSYIKLSAFSASHLKLKSNLAIWVVGKPIVVEGT